MTRTTISVKTVQLLIFLLGLLAASVEHANILVSASSCKQGANKGKLQAGHTKTVFLLPQSAGFSLEYCHTLIVQHLSQSVLIVSKLANLMSRKHSSLKDNKIV